MLSKCVIFQSLKFNGRSSSLPDIRHLNKEIKVMDGTYVIFFSCEDAAQQVLMSVRPSVCLQFEIPSCQGVLEGSRKFQKVPESSRRFQKVPESSRRFQKVLDNLENRIIWPFLNRKCNARNFPSVCIPFLC